MAKLPWWPFYGRDFFDDEHVKMMSNAQIGMYLKLLQHQWIEGSVPIGVGLMAFMDLRNQLHDGTRAEAECSWVIEKCFTKHPTLSERVYNLKLESIRREQIKKDKQNQQRARLGGLARQACLKQAISRIQAEPKLAIQSQNQKEIKKEKKKKSEDRRHLLECFELTDELRAWAMLEYKVVIPGHVVQEFKEHWLDQPNSKLKVNWLTTFKNRIGTLVGWGTLKPQPGVSLVQPACAYANEPCEHRAIPGSKYCQSHKDKIARLQDRKQNPVAVLVQDAKEEVSKLVGLLGAQKSMVVN